MAGAQPTQSASVARLPVTVRLYGTAQVSPEIKDAALAAASHALSDAVAVSWKDPARADAPRPGELVIRFIRSRVVLSLPALYAVRLAAQVHASKPSISSPDAGAIPRVRSTDARIAALIARAVDQSATFRSLVDRVAATDGIVYIETGRCGGVRACLTLQVTVAKPYRILWIIVDPRRPACEVMASVGHELWHALEVLREPSIRSTGALYFFITKDRDHNLHPWVETRAALRVGEDVLSELRKPCD